MINDVLRGQIRRKVVRESTAGDEPRNSQTVKTTEMGEERGFDDKRIMEGMRHIVVDRLGALMAMAVTSAVVDYRAAAPEAFGILSEKKSHHLAKLPAEGKFYTHAPNRWVAQYEEHVIEIVSRPPGKKGFQLRERWSVVQRTFASLGRCRIHKREHERLTDSSEA